ncbi:Uncharacterized protein FVE85_9286 [Porphyridium purpureum]|uniref:Uncharacterized protein n=1 Tax=Porphyridium purpureum TaxID=35688 RepID=A0A5J4YQP5_PORPP|nr:Uncharacterized protein FVE85_9286 [Porphyridium purpureum]|eukprot:POR7664..scf222_8
MENESVKRTLAKTETWQAGFRAELYGTVNPLNAALTEGEVESELGSYAQLNASAQAQRRDRIDTDKASTKQRRASVGRARVSLRLIRASEYFQTSLWTLPIISMTVNFIAGALIASVGEGNIQTGDGYKWWFNGTPEAALSIFTYVGGFIIGLTGTVFSLCIVAFQVAGVTYSARLLTGLMSRRPTKIVLCIFLGTFAYSFAGVMCTQTDAEMPFVPSVAVNVMVIHVVAVVLGLVYYLHYVVTSMNVSVLMDNVASDTLATIPQIHDPLNKLTMFEQDLERSEKQGSYQLDEIIGLPVVPPGALQIVSEKSGYLRSVSELYLTRMADASGFVVRLRPRIGEYITFGTLMAWLWFPDRSTESLGVSYRRQLEKDVRACFQYGSNRSILQDVEFGLHQITDVALKALKSGISDPTTASEALDRHERLFSEIAARRCDPRIIRAPQDGFRVLVAIPRPSFNNLLDSVAHPLRSYGIRDVYVSRRLQYMLGAVGRRVNQEVALVHGAKKMRLSSRIRRIEYHLGLVLNEAKRMHGENSAEFEAITYATEHAFFLIHSGKTQIVRSYSGMSHHHFSNNGDSPRDVKEDPQTNFDGNDTQSPNSTAGSGRSGGDVPAQVCEQEKEEQAEGPATTFEDIQQRKEDQDATRSEDESEEGQSKKKCDDAVSQGSMTDEKGSQSERLRGADPLESGAAKSKEFEAGRDCAQKDVAGVAAEDEAKEQEIEPAVALKNTREGSRGDGEKSQNGSVSRQEEGRHSEGQLQSGSFSGRDQDVSKPGSEDHEHKAFRVRDLFTPALALAKGRGDSSATSAPAELESRASPDSSLLHEFDGPGITFEDIKEQERRAESSASVLEQEHKASSKDIRMKEKGTGGTSRSSEPVSQASSSAKSSSGDEHAESIDRKRSPHKRAATVTSTSAESASDSETPAHEEKVMDKYSRADSSESEAERDKDHGGKGRKKSKKAAEKKNKKSQMNTSAESKSDTGSETSTKEENIVTRHSRADSSGQESEADNEHDGKNREKSRKAHEKKNRESKKDKSVESESESSSETSVDEDNIMSKYKS